MFVLRSRNKTLNGGRAERNEYILLHEFHRLKYICPDKTWGKKTGVAAAKVEAADDAEGGTAPVAKAKRDKYKGGLVFEPKRGLWDKYILVMDFNSLYPSIIQEYNIDFTTIDKTDDEVCYLVTWAETRAEMLGRTRKTRYRICHQLGRHLVCFHVLLLPSLIVESRSRI